MKNCKVPDELKYIIEEARPELIDTPLGSEDKGQVGSPVSCPFYDTCIINPKKSSVCEAYKNKRCYKHYVKYGADYNEMFI